MTNPPRRSKTTIYSPAKQPIHLQV